MATKDTYQPGTPVDIRWTWEDPDSDQIHFRVVKYTDTIGIAVDFSGTVVFYPWSEVASLRIVTKLEWDQATAEALAWKASQ